MRSTARSASSRGRAPGPPGPLGPPHGARAHPRAPPAPVLARTSARTAPPRTGERALCRGGAYSNPNAIGAGSRARVSGRGSVGSPRCARIAITAERSWTSLTIRRRPPHGQASTSSKKTRFSKEAQSMRAPCRGTTPWPSEVRALPLPCAGDVTVKIGLPLPMPSRRWWAAPTPPRSRALRYYPQAGYFPFQRTITSAGAIDERSTCAGSLGLVRCTRTLEPTGCGPV
jgi:hypothetical protein